MRTFAIIAALLGATGVAFGAFGAHALDLETFAEDMETWRTASRYHMYHALALLVATDVLSRVDGLGTGLSAGNVACWSFVFGTVVFSGSLYVLVWTDTRWLGAVTPIGGLALIVGWCALAYAILTI